MTAFIAAISSFSRFFVNLAFLSSSLALRFLSALMWRTLDFSFLSFFSLSFSPFFVITDFSTWFFPVALPSFRPPACYVFFQWPVIFAWFFFPFLGGSRSSILARRLGGAHSRNVFPMLNATSQREDLGLFKNPTIASSWSISSEVFSGVISSEDI